MFRCGACGSTSDCIGLLEHVEGHCRFWQAWTALDDWEHETKLDNKNLAQVIGSLRNHVQAVGIVEGNTCIRCKKFTLDVMCPECEREDS